MVSPGAASLDLAPFSNSIFDNKGARFPLIGVPVKCSVMASAWGVINKWSKEGGPFFP